LLRLLLVPLFLFLWWRGLAGWALLALAVAAITDVFDGIVARALEQETLLGQLLDPIADKATVLLGFLTAWLRGELPGWLTLLVVLRDALLLLCSGLFALFAPGRLGPTRWTPVALGKATTVVQMTTLVAVLARAAFPLAWLGPTLRLLIPLTALLTCASGAQYLLRGVLALRSPSGKLSE
jgi:cardiolipin synthase